MAKVYQDRKNPYVIYGKKKEKVYGEMITCKLCGKEAFVTNSRKNPNGNYCSPRCAGKAYKGNKSPKWKGGKRLLQNGYIEVTLPQNHPLRLKGKRYIAEHRLVIETYIKRHLSPSEFIHHLNGLKTDNRLENLAICTRQTHFEFIKKLQQRIRELENKH